MAGSQLVVKLSLVKTISPVPDAPNSPKKREKALSKKYEKLVVSRPEDSSYFAQSSLIATALAFRGFPNTQFMCHDA